MPAFERAVALGYRYLETDVHVTNDGELLAFHDDHLDRVTDGMGAIADLPWSIVREARVDGREPIPRFEDLLMAWPDVRVNVDAKHDAAVEPLAEVLLRTGAIDRVCVAAFSDKRIQRVQKLVGHTVCSSMGPRQVAQLVATSRGLPGAHRNLMAPCAQVPTHQGPLPLVTERLVAAAHQRGIQVHVWTIDDPTEMARLLDLGVDGIMTDRPQDLKDLLVARGQWVT
jgi:glycerophosphoryl diester phosphodiesterase